MNKKKNELQKELLNLRKEQFKIRIELNKYKKNQLKTIRRNIARIKTFIKMIKKG